MILTLLLMSSWKHSDDSHMTGSITSTDPEPLSDKAEELDLSWLRPCTSHLDLTAVLFTRAPFPEVSSDRKSHSTAPPTQ